MGVKDLVQVLGTMAPFDHPWVDPNVGAMEDAAVLRPDAGPPLAFTVDFITPVVDDPYAYGAIAAANSLSDVYAMGGEPQVALAICGFPTDELSRDVLGEILRGGRDKCAEADCAIAGGHTVQDPELKYGLCVLGRLGPGPVFTQTGGKPGDRLVLTKPLGFGVASQAIKKQRLPDADIARVIELMSMLNRGGRDAAQAAGVRAATDVTGFGFLGHLRHLAQASDCAARVTHGAVPLLDFARPLAREGLVPAGSRNNLAYVEPTTRFADALDEVERLLLADAQTSGGLLLAVPPEREGDLLAELTARGTPAQAVIGELVAGEAGQIEVVV